MKRLVVSIFLLLALNGGAAWALECANDGTPEQVQPDDDSDSTSVACGDGAFASDPASIAMGHDAKSSGPAAVAIGELTFADGETSVAIGDSANTAKIGGIAIGEFATSSDEDDTAIGFGTVASGTKSIAIGYSAKATAEGGLALGAFSSVTRPFGVVLGGIAGVNSATAFSNVGIGIQNPTAPLHIFRNDGTQSFLFLRSNQSGVTQDRAMMQLTNRGGIRFQFDNTVQGTAWRFQTATGGKDQFEVTKVGSGAIEMALDAVGNLTIRGTLTEMSDRNAKQDFQKLNGDNVLKRLESMNITEWAYRTAPDSRHIGPMAQDFHAAFGLGEDQTRISPRDMAGVNMAAIQELSARNKALASDNESLRADLANLQEQVRLLQQAVLGDQPGMAQN